LAPLARGPWTLFDEVEANQVVARIDDAVLREELKALQAELKRLENDLEANVERTSMEMADRQRAYLQDTARLLWELQRLQLTILEHRAQLETDNMELLRLNTDLEFLEPMLAKNMVPEREVVAQRLLRDEVARRIEVTSKCLQEAEAQQKELQRRLREYPQLEEPDVAKLIAPLEAAIEAQKARIEQVEATINSLVIRAPMRGTICAIYCWPGQQVRRGDPILTLAAQHGRYIVAYVRQDQRLAPQVDMPVEVRPRLPASRPMLSRVDRVGPQVEPVPLHHCRDPKTPEWGLPVRIALPAGFLGRPGELLDVTFAQSASSGE
jgi:multidrug resistance efflux pump